MAGSSGEDSSVWQGYVAAVASLAQAMLFLMAILVIALMQVSAQIDMSSKALVQKSKGEKPPAKVSAEEKKVAKKGDKSSEKGKSQGTPQAILKMVFAESTISLNPTEVTELKKIMASKVSENANRGTWDVFAIVDKNNSAKERLAYLRILEVRNILIRQGVASSNVQTNIKHQKGEQESAQQDGVVYINWAPKPQEQK